MSNGTLLRRGATGLIGAVVAAASALNLMKGMPGGIQAIGWPYWVLGYRHGFIRRGLVGTIFQALVGRAAVPEQHAWILRVHVLITLAMLSGLLLWAFRAARGASARVRVFVATGSAALLLSQFGPTVFSLAGYVDVILLALATATAALVDRQRYWAAGVLGAVGPFVHDGFLFPWLAVLLLAVRPVDASALLPRVWDKRRALELAPLALPVLASAFVIVAHSRSALDQSMAEVPAMDAGVRDSFFRYQYGLSTSGALEIMIGKYKAMPEQVALSAAMFLPPTVVIAACAVAIDRASRKAAALYAAMVSLAPLSILLVAWDLSRFLLWSAHAAFLLLLSNARRARETSADEAARSARAEPPLAGTTAIATTVVAALVAVSTGPHLYAYFEVAMASYGPSPSLLRDTLGARIAYAYLRTYNRKLFVESFAMDRPCEPETFKAERERDARPDSCRFLVRDGGRVESKGLWLPAGAWVATVTTVATSTTSSSSDGPSETCADPAGVLAVNVGWTFGGDKIIVPIRPEGGRVQATFDLTAEEAAMATVRVRTAATHGCFVVDDLRIERRPR